MSIRQSTQRHITMGSILGVAIAAALSFGPAAFAEETDSPATTIQLIEATSSSIAAVEVAGVSAVEAPQATVIEIGTATSSSIAPIQVAGTFATLQTVPTMIEIGEATSSSIPAFGLTPVADVVVADQFTSEPTVIEIGEATSSSIAAPTVPDARVSPVGAAVATAPVTLAVESQIQVSGTSASSPADPAPSAAGVNSSVVTSQQQKSANQSVATQSVIAKKDPAMQQQIAHPTPIAAVEPAAPSSLSSLGWTIPALVFGFLMFRMLRRSAHKH